jgi:hypothetical protein
LGAETSRKRGTTAVGMELKAGARLRSATDACEVVVVKAPGEAIDLRCGGQPFVAIDADVTTQAPAAGFDGGTQLGKRYADEALGLEVLCTKAGEGSISVGESVLEVKGAKPLPASD